MAAVTVRNLPEETHRALKLSAQAHGRSTEAEIREILVQAMQNTTRVKIGSVLAAFGQQFDGVDVDFTRDQTPTRVVEFE
jgi:plasmid stability protein